LSLLKWDVKRRARLLIHNTCVKHSSVYVF